MKRVPYVLAAVVCQACLVAALVLAAPATARLATVDVANASESQSCPRDAIGQIANARVLKQKTERFWRGTLDLPASGLSVSLAVCGDLGGLPGEEMVVVLAVDNGTGGSPKPWGIYDRRGGGFRLAHFDSGEQLICPTTPTIHQKLLTIYRPSQYEGAYTLCDEVVHYRWQPTGYAQSVARPSFHRCPNSGELPGEGGPSKAVKIRASKVSCAFALEMIRSSTSSSWDCVYLASEDESRCRSGRNPRKWISYVLVAAY